MKNIKVLASYEIVIPAFYDHSTWMESFIRRNKIMRYCDSSFDLRKSNFMDASDEIRALKNYKVEIAEIENSLSNNVKRTLVKEKGGLAVGGHALLLLRFLKLFHNSF